MEYVAKVDCMIQLRGMSVRVNKIMICLEERLPILGLEMVLGCDVDSL